MEAKIFQILYEYATKDRKIDFEYLNRIISEVILHKDLEQFYNETIFLTKNTSNKPCAKYNLITKNIYLDLESMEKVSCEYLSPFRTVPFNPLENRLSVITFYTHILLHELNHVEQMKKISGEAKTIEEHLLNICLRTVSMRALYNSAPTIKKIWCREYRNILYYIKAKNKMYKKSECRLNIPIERLAELDAIEEIIKILMPIKLEIPRLYAFYELMFQYHLFSLYQNFDGKLEAPTMKYLMSIYNDPILYHFDKEDLETFSFYSSDLEEALLKATSYFTKSERIYYGLPITISEYTDIKYSLHRKLHILYK